MVSVVGLSCWTMPIQCLSTIRGVVSVAMVFGRWMMRRRSSKIIGRWCFVFMVGGFLYVFFCIYTCFFCCFGGKCIKKWMLCLGWMPENVLVACDVCKSFGRLRVLEKVSLNLQRGDRYVLFGSNGAGKTTLLKILTTLLPMDSGELSVFGRKVSDDVNVVKAGIGLMSHESFLYNELSAWENLCFFADLYGVEDKEGRVKTLLKEVELFHRCYDAVSLFSHGMRRRLSLARALLHDPELVFLDEPYAGLDIRAKDILDKIIMDLNVAGKTFFVVTHDVDRGVHIGSRLGVLSKGNVVFESAGGLVDVFSKRFQQVVRGELC